MCCRTNIRRLCWLVIAAFALTGCFVATEAPPCCGAEPVTVITVEATPWGGSEPAASGCVDASDDWHIARVIETTPERFRIIDVSTLHARNCTGPNVMTLKESLSRTTTHEITIGGSASAEVMALVTLALEAEFEIKNGETFQRTNEHSVTAQPNSNIDYQFIWKEVWVDGYVMLQTAQGSETIVPFSLLKSLQDEPGDQVDLGCE